MAHRDAAALPLESSGVAAADASTGSVLAQNAAVSDTTTLLSLIGEPSLVEEKLGSR